MSLMNQLSSMVAGLAPFGHAARTRILKQAIDALTPDELARLDLAITVHEKEQAETFVRHFRSALVDTPVAEVDVSAAPEDVPIDADDPMTLLRAAAVASRKTALKAKATTRK